MEKYFANGKARSARDKKAYLRLLKTAGNENPRVVWVERDRKEHLVPTPCHGQGHLPIGHDAQSLSHRVIGWIYPHRKHKIEHRHRKASTITTEFSLRFTSILKKRCEAYVCTRHSPGISTVLWDSGTGCVSQVYVSSIGCLLRLFP